MIFSSFSPFTVMAVPNHALYISRDILERTCWTCLNVFFYVSCFGAASRETALR